MFEYIDVELVKAITLLMFSFLLYYASDDKKNRSLSIPLFFAVMVFFIATYFTKETAQTNKRLFLDEKALICKDRLSDYLVSKENGYRLDDNFFIKDTLMIRADRCEIKN